MRRDIITNKLDRKGAKVTDDTTHNGLGERMKDVSWTSSTAKERPGTIAIHSRNGALLPECAPLLRPAKPLLDTRAEDLQET